MLKFKILQNLNYLCAALCAPLKGGVLARVITKKL